MDALVAMARSASAALGSTVAPDPVVNVIVDHETFERELTRAVGAEVPRLDPDASARAVCRTDTGIPLTPTDALACALVGHVRRVVLGGDGSVVDRGRTQRLFTGALRDAILTGASVREALRCFWLACQTRGRRRLQIDHRTPWAEGGRTDLANGQVACGPHNRLKETGFTRTTGPDGKPQWLRPDGTPITRPA